MKGVSYDNFFGSILMLEKAGILKRERIFGYGKSFRDVLAENAFLYRKGSEAEYINSELDGETYCFTNGHFKTHLKAHSFTDFDYLEKCGVHLPIGYVTNLRCHGKRAKSFFLSLENGENLYRAYRSVLTSVSFDPKKLSLYYGMSEEEAQKFSTNKKSHYSVLHSGEKNASFGRRGINARCFTPFTWKSNPHENFSELMKEKKRLSILKWAEKNNIEELDFEEIRFLFYSQISRSIHRAKGEQMRIERGLDSTEQGIYLYNKEKSIKHYNPKDFLDCCLQIIKDLGTEEEEVRLLSLLEAEDYQGVLALAYSVRQMSGYSHKRFSYVARNGEEFHVRSKLEKGFLFMLDRLDMAESIKYENVRIPYTKDGKERIYYVDFDILLKNGKRILVEVKPYALSILPEGIILTKKEAAENFAKENDCIYVFVTEKDLKYDLFRKKLQSL